MNKAWSYSLLVAFALIATGCALDNDQVGGARRKIAVHTIVSLSPSTTELSSQLGYQGQLKGRTEACNWPDMVKAVPVVAEVKPDYERLKAISPDLVLLDKSLYSAADISKIKETAAVSYEWDPKDMAEYKKDVGELSSIVSQETAGSKYLDTIEEEVAAAKTRANGQKVRAALLMPDASGQHMWAGLDSFYADELRAASLDPVGPKGDKYVPLDVEAFVKDDPDFIFLASSTAEKDREATTKIYEAFIKDPRFSSLKAVKAGKVGVVNQDLAVRKGGRVDIFIKSLSRNVYRGDK